MSNDPVDLSPLDPSTNAQRWAARVAAVARGGAELYRLTPIMVIARWAAPALAAAALLAVVSVGASTLGGGREHKPPADRAYVLLSTATPEERAGVSTLALLDALELPHEH